MCRKFGVGGACAADTLLHAAIQRASISWQSIEIYPCVIVSSMAWSHVAQMPSSPLKKKCFYSLGVSRFARTSGFKSFAYFFAIQFLSLFCGMGICTWHCLDLDIQSILFQTLSVTIYIHRWYDTCLWSFLLLASTRNWVWTNMNAQVGDITCVSLSKTTDTWYGSDARNWLLTWSIQEGSMCILSLENNDVLLKPSTSIFFWYICQTTNCT